MNSPVIELQRLASDSSVRLSELLRKSLIVATKLGLGDFRTWVQFELKGYPNHEELPTYRKCSSSYYFRNPVLGLCPITILDDDIHDLFCEVRIFDSVESLESVLAKQGKDGRICYGVPPLIEQKLRELVDLRGNPVIRVVSSNSITSALDAVRTRVLEWALQLEAEGILGDGVMFSPEEKVKAQSSQVINIEQFHGVLGDINHSTVSHSFTQGIRKGDLESLIKAVASMGASQEDLDELRDAIAAEPELPDDRGFGKKWPLGWVKWLPRLRRVGFKLQFIRRAK